MNTPLSRSTIGSVLVLCCAAAVPAQDERRGGSKNGSAYKLATRLIRFLELPGRRGRAAAELLKMGPKAVPSLIRALDDPRPAVLAQLALVLRTLGPIAHPAVPKLREIAKGEPK